ncbi:hypothetical protein D9M73_124080 [compost metagenome]
MIDPIREARLAGAVGADQPVEIEVAPIRQDQPGPDHQRARLPKRHMRIVAADQARPLRDQPRLAGHAVEHILGNLRHDLAGKVGGEPGDKRGRDRRARLQGIATGSGSEPSAVNGRGRPSARNERGLPILCVSAWRGWRCGVGLSGRSRSGAGRVRGQCRAAAVAREQLARARAILTLAPLLKRGIAIGRLRRRRGRWRRRCRGYRSRARCWQLPSVGEFCRAVILRRAGE